MKKFLILFFLTSCISHNTTLSSDDKKINFDDNLTFDEFNNLLTKYAKENPYPNIDK